jgi:hypothetical protein
MASWTKGLCRAGQLTEGVCVGAAVHDFLLQLHGQREEMVGKLTGRGGYLSALLEASRQRHCMHAASAGVSRITKQCVVWQQVFHAFYQHLDGRTLACFLKLAGP